MEFAESDIASDSVVYPQRADIGATVGLNWAVYIIRVDLPPSRGGTALKIGMVGSGSIDKRLATHSRQQGPVELVDLWSVSHAARFLHEAAAWKLTEQYECRLQFAPEFADTSARRRRLLPGTNKFSYEWFEDHDDVLAAVAAVAPRPIHLPIGWKLAALPVVHGPGRGQLAQARRTPEDRSRAATRANLTRRQKAASTHASGPPKPRN